MRTYDLTRYEHCREAYGDALVELGKDDKDIVVLDADLSCSTKTEKFAKAFQNRFFNIGIAEQNMMGIAAGFARCGKTPYVSTFSMFGCGRAWEQIRNSIALDNLPVNIFLTHGGLSLGGDGATHQMLEDIALMRSIPNMRVMIPADIVETREITIHGSKKKGPLYVRLPRSSSAVLFDGSDYAFDPYGCVEMTEGSDVAIFSMGSMLAECIKAAYGLKREGISVKVVNLHTIKPLPEKAVLRIAKETGAIVSVEEHNVMGGMGSALSEFLIQRYPVPMKMIGVNDSFGCSGAVEELYAKYGLTQHNIMKKAAELVGEKV